MLENPTDQIEEWQTAVLSIARHYRLNVSSHSIYTSALWNHETDETILQNMCKQAGLEIRKHKNITLNAWQLPALFRLENGRIGVIYSCDSDEAGQNLIIGFSDDDGLMSSMGVSQFKSQAVDFYIIRPKFNAVDTRVDAYIKPVEEKWLWKTVFRDLKSYYYVIFGSLFVNLLGLAGITFSMQTYDRIIPAQSYPTMWVLFGGVLLAFTFDFILRLTRYTVIDILGKKADLTISNRVFGRALRIQNGARPQSTGTFISQLRELEQIREMITSSTVVAIADLPFFFMFLFIIYLLGGVVCLVPLAGMVLMVLPGFLCQKKLARLARSSMRESSLRSAMLVETVQGLDDIKFMQAEPRFQQQWSHYTATTAESSLTLKHLTHKLTTWSYLIQNSVFVFVVLVGTPLAISGELSTGALVASSILSSRMMAPISQIAGILTRWQQTKVSVSGLDSIMRLPVDSDPTTQKVHLNHIRGHFKMNNARFRHHMNDRDCALSIDELEIKPGEKIALLGRNGAGKSSLLNALAGQMVTDAGITTLDNIRLENIDPADLRRDVGYLSQTSKLFHGSVRENILLGAPLANDDQIYRALALAGALRFINAIHDGLDHIIMEGGIGLSGGQKQALLIARLILRNPTIVLLDEPTASFDETTEMQFTNNMHPWLAGKTLVIATHRKKLLELVDRIIVIDNGKVTVDAPREELINKL